MTRGMMRSMRMWMGIGMRAMMMMMMMLRMRMMLLLLMLMMMSPRMWICVGMLVRMERWSTMVECLPRVLHIAPTAGTGAAAGTADAVDARASRVSALVRVDLHGRRQSLSPWLARCCCCRCCSCCC